MSHERILFPSTKMLWIWLEMDFMIMAYKILYKYACIYYDRKQTVSVIYQLCLLES